MCLLKYTFFCEGEFLVVLFDLTLKIQVVDGLMSSFYGKKTENLTPRSAAQTQAERKSIWSILGWDLPSWFKNLEIFKVKPMNTGVVFTWFNYVSCLKNWCLKNGSEEIEANSSDSYHFSYITHRNRALFHGNVRWLWLHACQGTNTALALPNLANTSRWLAGFVNMAPIEVPKWPIKSRAVGKMMILIHHKLCVCCVFSMFFP